MRYLTMTFAVAATLLFVGGSPWKAEASTWSTAASVAAAVHSTYQVETIGCRRRGVCPWGRYWNGYHCRRCG